MTDTPPVFLLISENSKLYMLRITQEQRQYVVDHINDMPRSKVAAAAGISLGTVYSIVRRFGGKIGAHNPPAIVETIKSMYPTHTCREIAEETGIPKSTVIRWVSNLGLRHTEETERRIMENRLRILAEARKNIDWKERSRKWKLHRRMDELRVLSGLPQRTRHRFALRPRKVYHAMWCLCDKYGYEWVDGHPYWLTRPDGVPGIRQKQREELFSKRYKIKFIDREICSLQEETQE